MIKGVDMKEKIGDHWLRFICNKEQSNHYKVLEPYVLAHIEGIIEEIETDGRNVSGLRLKVSHLYGKLLDHYDKRTYVLGVSNITRDCNQLRHVLAGFLDNENISVLHASKGDDVVALGAFDFREVEDFEHNDFYIWKYWNKTTGIKIQFGDYAIHPERIESDLKKKYYHDGFRGWKRARDAQHSTVQ